MGHTPWHVSRAHVQRGGSPSLFDRVLATRYGVAAVDYVIEGRFGYMPALSGDRIVPCLIRDAVSTNRKVDLDLYELAQTFYNQYYAVPIASVPTLYAYNPKVISAWPLQPGESYIGGYERAQPAR